MIPPWKYLIPFPPPNTTSYFSYSFDVGTSFEIFGGGIGNAMAFVSLGETANLTTGTDIAANIDGGWPINADLSQPAQFYNGHYGELDGEITVERTFVVGRGYVPGVAIVVGAVVALPMQAEVALTFFNGFSGISIGSETKNGFGNLVAYSYEPQSVFHP